MNREKTGNCVDSGRRGRLGPRERRQHQALVSEFPRQRNREFSAPNREYSWSTRKYAGNTAYSNHRRSLEKNSDSHLDKIETAELNSLLWPPLSSRGGQPFGERWLGLIRAADDRGEAATYRTTVAISSAARTATASSMRPAEGRCRRPRQAVPGRCGRRGCRSLRQQCPQPLRTAAIRPPPRTPLPTEPPPRMRAPNWTGTVRRGVDGS